MAASRSKFYMRKGRLSALVRGVSRWHADCRRRQRKSGEREAEKLRSNRQALSLALSRSDTSECLPLARSALFRASNVEDQSGGKESNEKNG